MLDRRGFLDALLAAGACAALPACRTAPSRNPDVEAAILREIASGRSSCICCGAAGGPSYTLGNRRPGLGEEVPADGDSLFEIASVSKTFVALLAALLRYEGKLDIDAPFVKYLPDHVLAKEGTSITIRDLAAHVSGFTNGWMGPAGVYGKRPWPYADDAAYERAVLAVRPAFARRTKCVYSCHNMILMGFILERVSGLDLDALARKYAWGPLGMASTTWNNVPDNPRTVRMWTNGWRPLGTKGDENARGVKRPIGNAGVFTSLNDLLLYADDLAGRRAFPKECYELLFEPEYEQGRMRRSFGWDMGPGKIPPGWSDRTICHSGYTGQYVAVDPQQNRAAVVLSNLSTGDSSERGKSYEFRRTLAARL